MTIKMGPIYEPPTLPLIRKSRAIQLLFLCILDDNLILDVWRDQFVMDYLGMVR